MERVFDGVRAALAMFVGFLTVGILMGLALAANAEAQLNGCEDASLGGFCDEPDDIITVVGQRIVQDDGVWQSEHITINFFYSGILDPGYNARASLCVDYNDGPGPDSWANPCVTGPSQTQTRDNVNGCQVAGSVSDANGTKNMYTCDDGVYVAVREGFNARWDRWRNLNNP